VGRPVEDRDVRERRREERVLLEVPHECLDVAHATIAEHRPSLRHPCQATPSPMIVFHLAFAADWDEARRAGAYRMSTRGRTLDEEGFVHCSRADQVATVAANYYAAPPTSCCCTSTPTGSRRRCASSESARTSTRTCTGRSMSMRWWR